MFCARADSPRKMLPPPMTTATSTPSAWTSLISPAIRCTTPASMPKPVSPISASPLSLRRILENTGRGVFSPFPMATCGASSALRGVECFAENKSGKPADADILAKLADVGRQVVLDRDRRILYEWLFEQTALGVELLHLALDHLLDDRGRLAAECRLVPVDHTL